ncbi:MAG: hypothetical protein Q4C17_05280, partial [Bacillota bacterium]|nr:hypothetical protein [Bacillota bacterium]
MSEYGKLGFQCFSKQLEKVRDYYAAASTQWEKRLRGGAAALHDGAAAVQLQSNKKAAALSCSAAASVSLLCLISIWI